MSMFFKHWGDEYIGILTEPKRSKKMAEAKVKKETLKEDKKDLLSRIRKNTTIKESSILSKSVYFNEKDVIPTGVPMINVALSGRLDGGFIPGLTMWAGPSKHFKTAFSLLMIKAYMDKYPEAVLLFYDSEFGTPKKYFETFGINMDRVIHSPLVNIEVLKFDIMKQLQEIERGDKIIIFVDSVGNLASKKEIEDALAESSKADMSRPKQVKSLFRMVTPHLNLKDIPMIVVNHTYKTQDLYPSDVVSGGTGSYYSADNIYIVGRQQDKDGKELLGYSFIINVEKSRYVKEKTRIPVDVSFESGIGKYSGLMDVALESGHVDKPVQGWYCKVNKKTGECSPNVRLSQTNTAEFWDSILNDEEFKEFVMRKYTIAYGNIMGDTEELIESED
jgi:RecA/RadA recombinase